MSLARGGVKDENWILGGNSHHICHPQYVSQRLSLVRGRAADTRTDASRQSHHWPIVSQPGAARICIENFGHKLTDFLGNGEAYLATARICLSTPGCRDAFKKIVR